jgi:hypothetical protein
MRGYYGNEKMEFRIYQVTDFGKRLIDTHSDKTYTIKKASKLAYGNRNLIQVEWLVGDRKITCKFDILGEWYL